MNQLKIIWKKELKNCVPFRIFVNGVETCLVKRGEEYVLNTDCDKAELYFVPKAPRWFGWKALKLNVQITKPYSELHLAVQLPNNSLMGRFLPQEMRNAANINNQLHCIDADGVEFLSWEYVKKY